MHMPRDPTTKSFAFAAEALSSDRLFHTPTHQDVLGELSRALVKAPGFSALTGEAGTGKTTLVRQAILGWPGPVVSVAKDVATLARAVAALTRLRNGKTPGILVVEDAQALPADGLAALNVLSPITMPHVILVGRSELWARLQDPALTTLRDRIHTRCVLFPLSYGEAERYVEHLFRLGGAGRGQILGDRERHAMLLAARGNIRRINTELLSRLAPRSGRASPSPWVAGVGAVRHKGGSRGATGWLLGATAVAVVAGGSLFVAAPNLMPDLLLPDLLLPAPPVRVYDGTRSAASAPPPLHDPSIPPEAAGLAAGRSMTPATVAGEGEQPAPELTTLSPDPAPAAPETDPMPGLAATPTPASPAPDAVPAALGPGPLPDEVVAILVRRGEAMMELRDVSAARRFFERAALEGSGVLRARAALDFAATYDPGEGGPGSWVGDADAAVALAWYSLAVSLGSPEALAAVRRLAATSSATSSATGPATGP